MDRDDVAALFSLQGTTAVVTGGSRGLGRSIALGFAAAGANVVVASRRVEACAAVVEEVRARGGAATAVGCHMGDDAQVRGLVDATLDQYGRLDILVNNAATALRTGIVGFDGGAWDKAMQVNARGPLALLAAAVEPLSRSDRASVVNVLSVGGQRGSMSALGYGSAKAAMRHATEAAAAELAPLGIRVNALVPGPFATQMLTSADDDFQAASIERTLLRRMAQPDEIVGAAIFLASRASSYVTGSLVVVDGGLLA
jgi:NAD(P)-dependent dehydrogenase (short-subunit alcohol dehydrogenase family)